MEKKSANIIKVYYIDSCELQNFHSEIISVFFFTRAIFRAISWSEIHFCMLYSYLPLTFSLFFEVIHIIVYPYAIHVI